MINKKYKDVLFRIAFKEKEQLISLYNALNGTNYEDDTEFEITTLEDATYIGHKNDVSFLIDDMMNLYEHQSILNPNMPIRGLQYFASLYSAFIGKMEANIYGSRLIKLPTPKYVVLCNIKSF